jgi:ubiquinone/menaquinone biosynthesis C-methylase UbiE
MSYVIAAIVSLLLLVLFLGLRRARVPRQISNEGIENDAVVEAYNRINRWPQFRILRKIFIAELKKHQPEGVLADIGCGPGYLIADLARSFPNISIKGVDIAEEMLTKANENVGSLGVSQRISFHQGDIGQLPFEDGSIDFIVSTLSLHHWSEPEQAINELHRVLKQGGQFLVFDVRRDSFKLMYWIIRFAQAVILPKALKHINEPTGSFLAAYTVVETEEILGATLFKQCEVKPGPFWLFVWGKKGEAD